MPPYKGAMEVSECGLLASYSFLTVGNNGMSSLLSHEANKAKDKEKNTNQQGPVFFL